MTFDEWYAARYTEWWEDKKDDLRQTWARIEAAGVPADVIVATFDDVSYAIQDQYE